MRVVLCQRRASQDPGENRRWAARAVLEAAGAGGEVVVLPEATQCGFGRPDADLWAVAEPLDGPFVEALAKAAGEAGALVVAGMFEAPAGPVGPEGTKVWNTLVVLGPQGLVARYRKVHLYDALGYRESDRLAPGDPDELVVVPAGDGQLGVMTCYDLRFPELARALALRGASVVAVPAAWQRGPGKAQQWRVLLQARAIENTCYVVAADQPAPEYQGMSMAVDPRGHQLAALDETEENKLVIDLPPERVEAARSVLPLLAARRFDVVPRA